MKLQGFIITLLLLFGVTVYNAQTVEPSPTPQSVSVDCKVSPEHPRCKPIVTTQGFMDDATQAFDLVVAQRNAIDALLNTKNLQAEERKAWELVRDALNAVISTKDKIIASYDQLVQVQQKIITMYQGLVEKMQAEMGKKKSFLDKVLDTLKKVAYIATGILLGKVAN